MRRFARAAVLLLALPWPLLSFSRVRADPFHYQTLPLGQRALGMGGAFTGLADDPSAAYYNPAGLALIDDSALSASLTVNAFDRRAIRGGYRTRVGATSLRHDLQPNLPVFVTLVKKIGRKDDRGKRRHALALATFTVDQRKLAFDVELRGQALGSDRADTLSSTREEVTTWNGLAYGYRASSRLSFGVGAFLSHTRTRYDEEHISVGVGTVNRARGTYETDDGLWHTYRTRSAARNAVFRFGVLYQYDRELRVGLMLQPASIHLSGSADVRERFLAYGPLETTGHGTFLNASESGLHSRYPLPWELRLGGSYKVFDWVTLALDASLYGRTGNRNNPVVMIGARTPNAETGAVPSVGALALETWYRRVTGNVSLGGEAVFEHTFAARAGMFTSLSAAPDVPRMSTTNRPADVNLFGGAVSAGYIGNGYDLSLGLAGMFGFGDALAYEPDGPNGATYYRTGVTDRMLFVFLSGAKSAVGRLAATADKKLQQMHREDAVREAAAERDAVRPRRVPEPEP